MQYHDPSKQHYFGSLAPSAAGHICFNQQMQLTEVKVVASDRFHHLQDYEF